mmetsp:Transcript_33299/g.61909  ORF Transcript_33299/g.61909 Transcript_33299/m.61909 type:complete len:92 (-) Transcript_33299:497-772(-)|eukprot:CAMPEP_0170195784 /NCGR_PEP_ID=MMETSP0040_2-20121228/62205_1 /TAXON_ID=641309 /ORGANISM="Lotharella oceanica, Strain CCMP622" /LENGTH=91 /DNA_ID=CAMNT_0010445027 /DNA_START=88 /DNA_END=363 /DNA_ORIENTATION=+
MICALILPTDPLPETGGKSQRRRRRRRRRKLAKIEMVEREKEKFSPVIGEEKFQEDEELLNATEGKASGGVRCSTGNREAWGAEKKPSKDL